MNGRRVALAVILGLLLLLFFALFGTSVSGILAPTPEEPRTEDPPPPLAEGTATENPPERAPPPDEPYVGRGRVIVPHAEPPAGVGIEIEYLEYGSTSYPKDCGSQRVETDDSGDFNFQIPRAATFLRVSIDVPEGFLPLPVREYHLGGGPLLDLEIDGVPQRVPASGIWDARLGVDWDGTWRPIEVVLTPGRVVRVCVVDLEGEPVPWAVVRFRWGERPGVMQVSGGDADGSGVFRGTVPLNLQTTVAASSGVHGVSRFSQVVPTDVEEVTVVLGGHPVRIRPTTPDGNVVVLGTLCLRSASGQSFQERFRGGRAEEIVVEHVPAGEYLAVFVPRHPDHGPGTAVVNVPGDGEPVRLDLSPALEIRGIVEGQDVEGFRVSCRTSLHNLLPEHDRWPEGKPGWERLPGDGVSVGAEGSFRIPGLASLVDSDTFLTLNIRRPGDPRMALLHVWPEDLEEVEPLRVPLVRGHAIYGRVTGLAERELPGGFVRASRGVVVQQAEINPDGTFAIVGLPEGRYRLEVRGCGIGHDLWLAEQRNVPTGSRDVVLHVTR